MTRQDKNKLALTNDDKTNKNTKGDVIDLFSGNKGQASRRVCLMRKRILQNSISIYPFAFVDIRARPLRRLFTNNM